MTEFKLIIVFLFALAFLACGQSPDSNAPANLNNVASPVSQTPASAPDVMAQGRKLYIDNCAACHKEDGRGGKITIDGNSIDPEDLTTEKIKAFPDDKMYSYVYNGIEDEGMPAFKDKLSEAEIREVVRYIRINLQKMPESKRNTSTK